VARAPAGVGEPGGPLPAPTGLPADVWGQGVVGEPDEPACHGLL